jgi:hypothetical protein
MIIYVQFLLYIMSLIVSVFNLFKQDTTQLPALVR